MSSLIMVNPTLLTALFGGLLAMTLLALAVADGRRLVLPDALIGLLAVGGLAQCCTLGIPPLRDAGLGALIGSGLLAFLSAGFARLRGYEGLGLGDIKLTAAGALWVGWQGLPVLLLVASLSALAFAGLKALSGGPLERQTRIPFGPFLGAGVLIAWGLMIAGSP